MYYYKVRSSHWTMDLEFKSKIRLTEGQCFRIKNHDGVKSYPTRFKVLEVSDTPKYTGPMVEMLDVDLAVDEF